MRLFHHLALLNLKSAEQCERYICVNFKSKRVRVGRDKCDVKIATVCKYWRKVVKWVNGPAVAEHLNRLPPRLAISNRPLFTSQELSPTFRYSSSFTSFGEPQFSERMLEVSRTVNGHGWGTESRSRPPSSGEALKEYAYKLCKDYLRGAWLNISASEMVLKKVSGGLSNLLYYCSLPEGVTSAQGEPSRLLLRLYGNVNGSRAIETLVTESVIFTLLSESQRGPRLYGVFSGGRLEEYIPARALLTTELADPQISRLIADKIAQIHLMDVPINKQPKWLWHTMHTWVKQIEELIESDNIQEGSREMINTMKALNLSDELVWLKEFLVGIKSPVVFCHNDLQEGNILLRERANSDLDLTNGNDVTENGNVRMTSDSLVVIDFEYCSYNYRGFDFANHFCEWFYDYSNQEPPYFYKLESNQAETHHKEHLVKNYLAALRTYPEYKEREEDDLPTILREIEAFTLASHFFWGLWSVLNSSSEINFDYWSYGQSRFQSYYNHKSKILSEFDVSNGP
ncbi:choline ethanolamine [Nesidiocoris tenuis]|uniref:Choline ethanolamine n=1 Tax=Nesidiocoris tenuis TaxID=355587 RepID=A0ABN7A6J0_9HEMI|nr:choline ethanolamine [Nesidiocoris tenuis]